MASNIKPNVFKSLSNLSGVAFSNAHAKAGSQKCLFSPCFTLVDDRILLENGEINSKWLEQTYKLAEKAGNELKKCDDIMSKLSDREVHTVEHIMSYVVCDDAETAEKDLKNNSDSTLVTVFRDNRKVYCVPSIINKGNAVKRFAEMFGECLSIGAGDGEQDISMLEYVDIPIAAQSIGSRIKNANKIVCDDSKVFTDSICNELLKLNISFA